MFSSFIVCSRRNRSALVRNLLSNNSLCVGQLYARDLILYIIIIKMSLFLNTYK